MLNNCLVLIYTSKQDITIAKAPKFVMPWYEGVSPVRFHVLLMG